MEREGGKESESRGVQRNRQTHLHGTLHTFVHTHAHVCAYRQCIGCVRLFTRAFMHTKHNILGTHKYMCAHKQVHIPMSNAHSTGVHTETPMWAHVHTCIWTPPRPQPTGCSLWSSLLSAPGPIF